MSNSRAKGLRYVRYGGRNVGFFRLDISSSVKISWSIIIIISPWPPHYWGFYITHKYTHPLGLPYRCDQLFAKAATYSTQQTQETKSHAINGIRTHNASNQATAGLQLRPHSNQYRHVFEHGWPIFLADFKFWTDSVSRERRDVGRTNSLENSTAFLLLKALVNDEVSIIPNQLNAPYPLSLFLQQNIVSLNKINNCDYTSRAGCWWDNRRWMVLSTNVLELLENAPTVFAVIRKRICYRSNITPKVLLTRFV
jgi:hypothetical protein